MAAEYYDFNDDVILPDDFDAAALDGANAEGNSETPVPTTEPGLGDSSMGTQPVAEASTSEVQPEGNTEPTTTPEIPVAPQTIKIKFNHEEREIGLEEAATLAQKGMNYDKLDERIKAYEANLAKTNTLAKNLGYDSADEMIAAAEQNYVNRQIKELVDAGNTEAMARFLVEQKMAKAAADAQTQNPQPQEKPTPEAEVKPLISTERQAELDEFVKAYPGITRLPDEVLAANRNGVRLKTAYDNYVLQQKYDEQQKQLNILKQNQAAANRAPVTGVVGKASPKSIEPDDPFLKGFDSDL